MARRKVIWALLWAGATLAALAPAAAGSEALAPAAAGRDLVFKLKFEIAKGNYKAGYDCQCNHDNTGGYHTLVESDNHITTKTVYTLKIPRHGDPGPMSVKADSFTVEGKFFLSGAFYTQDNADTPITCNGAVAARPDVPTLESATNSSGAVHFLTMDIQPAMSLVAKGVTGTNCGSVSGKWSVFWPFSDESGWVPEILTPRIRVSLRGLRKMHVGSDLKGAGFHEGKALQHLPGDCQAGGSGSGGSCSDSLHWFGTVFITRTG